MRIFRHVFSIVIITFGALAYVHQQVELVKLSYAIDCKEKILKEVLDHRAILRYNISTLESPSRLEKVLLARNIKVAFPKQDQIVRVVRTVPSIKNGKMLGISGLQNRAGIFRLFDFLGAQAEAHVQER